MRTFLLFCLGLFTHINLIAQDAPDFTVQTSTGETFQLYNYLNNGKTVVIKFFFTSCSACKAIAPATEELYQEWGGGNGDVEFISLTILGNDDDTDVNNFKSQYGITYPGVSADGGSSTAIQPYTGGTFGQFFGTPTFAVIAPDRSVQFDVDGNGIDGTIAALDAAIASTGAINPNATPNFYSAVGSAYYTDGNVVQSSNLSFHLSNELGMETSEDNPFTFPSISENTNFTLSAILTDTTLNGITTYDIVLMNAHILAINEFDHPIQLIAADVNNDNKVTTFDIVILRQFILGITDALPQNWRVLPIHPDAINDPLPTSTVHQINAIQSNLSNLNFTFIKMGDVSTFGN